MNKKNHRLSLKFEPELNTSSRNDVIGESLFSSPNLRSRRKSIEDTNENIISEILKEIKESRFVKLNVKLDLSEENEDNLAALFTSLDDSDVEENSFSESDFFEEKNKSLKLHLEHFFEKKDETWHCKTCNGEYKTMLTMQKHIVKEINDYDLRDSSSVTDDNNVEELFCFICHEHFNSKMELEEHHSVHGDNFPCDSCSVVCNSIASYQSHRAAHVEPKQHACTECSFIFSTYFALRKHIRIDHLCLPPERYKCPLCGKITIDILNHANSHKLAQSKCETCGRKFKNRECFTMHMWLHGDPNEDWICLICNRLYMEKNDFSTHITFHEQDYNRMEMDLNKRSNKRTVDKSCGLDYSKKCLHEDPGEKEFNLLSYSKESDTSDLNDYVQYSSKIKNEAISKKRRLF